LPFALLHLVDVLSMISLVVRKSCFVVAGPLSGLWRNPPIVLLRAERRVSLCLELMYGYAALREKWGREKSD
jgi:hypothetical protein